MPKIDIAAIPVRERTGYPPPYAEAVKGRLFQVLGDAAGLTQFGVNLVRLKPGAASSQRHWHENEDEFVIVIEGELALIEDEGETVLRAGDAAGFKAGVPNGHHLINRSERDGVFLVVGSRAPTERAHYPDVDLAYEAVGGRVRYTNKAGEPFA
jgi:uncharacterized cupin superfamily protein